MKPTAKLVTVITVLHGSAWYTRTGAPLLNDVLLWQQTAFFSESHKPCEKETRQSYVTTRQSDIVRECMARRRGNQRNYQTGRLGLVAKSRHAIDSIDSIDW